MTALYPTKQEIAVLLQKHMKDNQGIGLSIYEIFTYMDDPTLYAPSETLIEATM